MLYGPRDEHELATAQLIVEAAYVAAGGARQDAIGRTLGALQVEDPGGLFLTSGAGGDSLCRISEPR